MTRSSVSDKVTQNCEFVYTVNRCACLRPQGVGRPVRGHSSRSWSMLSMTIFQPDLHFGLKCESPLLVDFTHGAMPWLDAQFARITIKHCGVVTIVLLGSVIGNLTFHFSGCFVSGGENPTPWCNFQSSVVCQDTPRWCSFRTN